MAERSSAAEIACSLSAKEIRERRATARASLLPHLVEVKKLETGLKLTFPETDTLRAGVEVFVGLERQCCEFLTFTITPPDQGLTVTIEGPPEARATIDMFAAAVAGAP